TINETTKGKAEGGGCFELNIGDSLCTKCYTSKVQRDRNIKYQRHRLNTSQESYLPTTKKLRKELNKLNTNISSSSEIIELQNEIDNLKNSIDNLKQEMESITRPSVDKIKEKNEIVNRHKENLEEYIEKNINSLIIGLIDDYHDIHQSRNPTDEKLSQVAHMANTMIHAPKISPIPYFSNMNEPLHNPLNIDVDLLSWVLTNDYISLFGISYVERKSSWFCISDSSNLTEDSLIDHLTIHNYESDLHINHIETRKMDTVKLVDFIPQELKSLDDYLNSIDLFIKIPLIDNYLSEFIIPVPADYPGQYFIWKAITLRQRYQENSVFSRNTPKKNFNPDGL
ncbi:8614_t:CDS:2, partial [Entrophospora sp. SA101]